MKTIIADESHIPQVATSILEGIGNRKIILLKGNLGSGKTTLTKIILSQLGILGAITSPTFNIVNDYSFANDGHLYHFDLYRIKSIEELYEIGFEEYLDSGNICIIEWPEIAEELLPNNCLKVTIQMKDSERIYQID